MSALEESASPWDVFPKLIRVSVSSTEQSIPLSIRGVVDEPIIESSNEWVARVDQSGTIVCGSVPGAAIIMVWRSSARDSLRHVQIEVFGNADGER